MSGLRRFNGNRVTATPENTIFIGLPFPLMNCKTVLSLGLTPKTPETTKTAISGCKTYLISVNLTPEPELQFLYINFLRLASIVGSESADKVYFICCERTDYNKTILKWF